MNHLGIKHMTLYGEREIKHKKLNMLKLYIIYHIYELVNLSFKCV